MKKLTVFASLGQIAMSLLVICLLLFSSHQVKAQKPGKIPNASQLVPVEALSPANFQPENYRSKDIVGNHVMARPKAVETSSSAAKVASVSPVALGRSSNIFSSIRTQQNQVVAEDSIHMVAFIHRQDITLWGGGAVANGIFRYDLSVDGGQSFTNDIGTLNPTTTWMGRYPQATSYNPPGGIFSPFLSKLVYAGPSNSGTQWVGITAGVSDIALANPASTQTHYNFSNSYLTGGLCEGLQGEYWMVDQTFDTLLNSLTDSIRLYKGIWNVNTQDVDWTIHLTIVPNWNTTFDGDIHAISPIISFSPDGQMGWIGLLGDLVGGPDSVLSPILINSSDGGATWGAAQEIDLGNFSWLSDTLKSLWVDTSGNPISTGRATCAFDFDLTVDGDYSPHFAVVVGSAGSTGNPLPGYSIYSGLSKVLVDLTSLNQGNNWTLLQVAPILTFRANIGGGSSQVVMDNFPQVSRSSNGKYIFYSWVDSDTAVFTGNQNGVGFGESNNLAPNLMISGLNTLNGYRTCYRGVTNTDPIWDGRAFFPTMAPEVLAVDSGLASCFKLPIVMTELLANDPLQPVQYHYFGNDATFGTGDFQPPGAVQLAWGQSCTFNYSACNLVPTFNGISGLVWADTNSNGSYDPGEWPLPNILADANPGSWYGSSDTTGNYTIVTLPGNYTVGATPPNYYTQTFPAGGGTYSVNVNTPGSSSTGNDFGMSPIPNMDDLVLTLFGPFARPGFPTSHIISLKNVGTTTQSGNVTYVHDTLLDYISAQPLPNAYNAGTKTMDWNFSNLSPTQSIQWTVNFNVPTWGQLNYLVGGIATAPVPTNEQSPANNADTLNTLIVNSYDPNDKTPYPEGIGPTGLIQGNSWIEYRIRFQNTGNAPAIRIRVEDTLDPNLDVRTFQMLGASHAYTYSIHGHGDIEWRFENINLPDSVSDEPNSHGYIRYRIKMLDNLSDGTSISNTASIYFDYNSPVATNTTLNTVQYVVGVEELTISSNEFRVFPNPFEDRTTFQLGEHARKSYDFALYDINGHRLVQHLGINETAFVLDGKTLAAGIYFFEFSRSGIAFERGKVILRK